MTRFRRDSLIDLGGGWARLPRAGEELYRIVVASCPHRTWMVEAALAELELHGMPCEVESCVVPPRPPRRRRGQAAPDPRQLELPVGDLQRRNSRN